MSTSDNGSRVKELKKGDHAIDTTHLTFRTYSIISQLHQAFAGAAAGCLTRTLTQPFDVLKIRFQLQVEPVRHRSPPNESAAVRQSKYTSLRQAIRLIYREEGVKAFWKGHNAGQVMSIVYAVIQFWSYEQFKLSVSQFPLLEGHDNMVSFLSGALAGSAATVFAQPFDVIRTRLVAQDPGAGYRNSFHAFPVIIRTEGVRGLFRGLFTTLIQTGPLVGGNFLFYKIFNDFAIQLLEPAENRLPPWILLANGGLAGICAKSTIYPLDFIKKRLQIQGFEEQRRTFGKHHTCTGIMSCIRLTIREEGVIGFYKGMTPTLLKSGLTTAFYFSIYDYVKYQLDH